MSDAVVVWFDVSLLVVVLPGGAAARDMVVGRVVVLMETSHTSV